MAVADAGRISSPRDRWYNNPTARSIAIQILLIVVVIGTIAWFTNNTVTNLHQRGIASGFGFLGQRAGFDMTTFLNTNSESTYGFMLLAGLLDTIVVSILSIVIATILGLIVVAVTFVLLLVIPVDFTYWVFAVIIFFNGVGSGMFAAPNRTAIMNAVPADQRGAASGMTGTFQNAGNSLSIGIFFSLMIGGLASTLPAALTKGLTMHHVPAAAVHAAAQIPPVGNLFAAFLGINPINALLEQLHVASAIPKADLAALTGKEFFPSLISGPFHDGLVIVFIAAAIMSVIGAIASAIMGGKYLYQTGSVTTVGPRTESTDTMDPAETLSDV